MDNIHVIILAGMLARWETFPVEYNGAGPLYDSDDEEGHCEYFFNKLFLGYGILKCSEDILHFSVSSEYYSSDDNEKPEGYDRLSRRRYFRVVGLTVSF